MEPTDFYRQYRSSNLKYSGLKPSTQLFLTRKANNKKRAYHFTMLVSMFFILPVFIIIWMYILGLLYKIAGGIRSEFGCNLFDSVCRSVAPV